MKTILALSALLLASCVQTTTPGGSTPVLPSRDVQRFRVIESRPISPSGPGRAAYTVTGIRNYTIR